MKKKCPICQKMFEPKPNTPNHQKFCSKKCHRKFTYLKYQKPSQQRRPCKFCNELFLPTKSLWAYCSIACKNSQYEKEHPTIKLCRSCKKEIVREKGKKKYYCDENCKQKYYYSQIREKKGHKKIKGTFRICPTCKKEFEIKSINQIYCDKVTCGQPKLIICKECNLEKPHQGHGLCVACWKKQDRLKKNPPKKEICIGCGIEFYKKYSFKKYHNKTCYIKTFRNGSWYQNYITSPEFKQARNKRYSKWLKKEPENKLNHRMAGELNRSLKRQNIKKNLSWEAIVGYSVNDLRKHLESLWDTSWMTWENYGNGDGKWVIDHIKPKSSFKFETIDDPEVKKCWGLENLRPYPWRKNLQKGKKDIG